VYGYKEGTYKIKKNGNIVKGKLTNKNSNVDIFKWSMERRK